MVVPQGFGEAWDAVNLVCQLDGVLNGGRGHCFLLGKDTVVGTDRIGARTDACAAEAA